MKLTQSKFKVSGEQINWYLYAHRIELSKNELMEIINNIKRMGLFKFLEKERPILKDILVRIVLENVESIFWENLDKKIPTEKYIEHYLEQCLIEIYNHIKH